MSYRFALMWVIFCVSCEQTVHLKASSRITKIVIDERVIEPVGQQGHDVQVPIKFGPASYSLYENEKLIQSGLLPRSQISPLSFGLSIGGALILTPALALSGVLLVNPSWIFASSVVFNGGGSGSFWAYIAQTASFWTVPAALLGAAVGLLPLIGLVYSERLPDVISIAIPESMRL